MEQKLVEITQRKVNQIDPVTIFLFLEVVSTNTAAGAACVEPSLCCTNKIYQFSPDF